MRITYTSDLHGHLDSYRALVALAVQTASAAVVVGGDLLPRTISRESAIQVQRRFIEESLAPLLVEVRTTHPHLAIYLLPGNDDWAAAIASLERLAADGLCWLLHENVYPLGHDTWIAGYACVPLTPFSIKDYERYDDVDHVVPAIWSVAYTSQRGFPEPISAEEILQRPSIGDELANLATRSDPARTIYVCHAPPYDTGLDLMRARHSGSRALRRFIEYHQPPLTLHGHIHESPRFSKHYAEQIGVTWCINPGHEETRFSAVTFDSDDLPGTIQHTLYGDVW